MSSRPVRSSGGSPGQRKLRRDPNQASVFTPREEESLLVNGSPAGDRVLAPEEPRRFSKEGIAAASERLMASGSCVSLLHSCASTGPMVNGKGSPPSSRVIRDAWDQPVRVSSLELATALGLDLDLDLEMSEPSERGVGEPGAEASSWADAPVYESEPGTAPASAPASAPSAAESRATGGADAAAKGKEKAKKAGEADDPKRVKGKADAKDKGKEAKLEEDKKKAGAQPPQSQRGREPTPTKRPLSTALDEPTPTKRPLSTALDASLLSERDVKRLEQAGPRRMHIDYASFDNARRGAQASAVLGEPSGASAGNSMRGSMAGAPPAAAAVGGGGGSGSSHSGSATPKREESPRRDASPRDRLKKGTKDAKREAGGGKRPTTVLVMRVGAPPAAEAVPPAAQSARPAERIIWPADAPSTASLKLGIGAPAQVPESERGGKKRPPTAGAPAVAPKANKK